MKQCSIYRNTTTVSSITERVSSAPQTMQWAVRSRTKPGRGGSGGGGGDSGGGGSGSYIFMEQSLRRSTAASSSATSGPGASTNEPVAMATTCNSLARAFGIVLRQISQELVLKSRVC